ncbi:CPBP family intramembrane glutamic endopeptidase [Clostridium chromiireducens]|uniref:CPBP family intramembrane metalloprotease n=1 Tax=Clostridium chromiireducens TaxID=225345 RepID=A0A1V4IEK9_9CLOT|nr:CPBP family intramembrane glutamic endopeptidase [Clostridium chromiireducens]OPJ58085.1 hypothetical protein CLCHR_41030 [Clostridium chromiireducens]RII35880.1 CPBP family intramembrane metalloprotease [Clostridium chromiireducens]
MKYEKIFLLITFSLSYFISIVLLSEEFIGALLFISMIPAFAAIISNLIESASIKVLLKPFIYKVSFKSLMFAVFYPLIIIFLCASSAILIKCGVLSQDLYYASINIFKLILISIVFFVVGLLEEYGWRGYLLPRLINRYNLRTANLIMGLILILYKLPAIIILNLHYNKRKFILYILLQTIAIWVINYAFTHLFTLSANVILPSIMHTLWNNVNIAVLGDTYRNASNGLILGRTLLINGQCLFGVIFLSIFAVYAHRRLLKISSA